MIRDTNVTSVVRTASVVDSGFEQELARNAGNTSVAAVTDEIETSYDTAFKAAVDTGQSIYGTMSPIVRASHERRMALLAALDIGSLDDKVCVDYGVGSWGFACIYPRLQACGLAIGIDISNEALRESARLSHAGNFPYERRYVYLHSRGNAIELHDESVDLFFAGESLEHVDDPTAFLDEVHRVLKPGGQLVLTTPNAGACLYRLRGEEALVGPEHIGLLHYAELRALLDPRFDTEEVHGYNCTFHYLWDETIQDAELAALWARAFEEHPELASGVVLRARRRAEYRGAQSAHEWCHHSSPRLAYTGSWTMVPLHRQLTGHLADGARDASVRLAFEGTGVIVQCWCHPWSGEALFHVGDRTQRVDLYSPVGGFRRVELDGLPNGRHELRIDVLKSKNPRSQSAEVILHQVVTYTRTPRTT